MEFAFPVCVIAKISRACLDRAPLRIAIAGAEAVLLPLASFRSGVQNPAMLPAFKKLVRFRTLTILPLILCATVFATPAFAEQSRLAPASALTNWQVALNCFQKAGASIGENKFDRARTELAAASTKLALPYSTVAAQFVTRLDSAIAISPDPKNAKRLKATVMLCAELRAYDVAVRLQSAASSAEDLEDDLTYPWRLFEAGNTKAALIEYKRKLAEETVDTFADYYREQIRLAEQRADNRTNVHFSLDLVRFHYLKGYEENADSLSAVQELHRVLPHAVNAKEALAVVEAIISRLGSLGDELGRDAWEDRLLSEFKTQPGACANVLLERGLRAFGKKDYPQTLTLLRQVCSEYSNTLAYGDAQYTVGLALQQQEKFDEAVEEYHKIFPSNVRDYDLDPDKSDDCKNYRHRAALRISECYAAKKDFARAISYAEQAKERYVYVSYCENCLKASKAHLDNRIKELRALAESQPSVPKTK